MEDLALSKIPLTGDHSHLGVQADLVALPLKPGAKSLRSILGAHDC